MRRFVLNGHSLLSLPSNSSSNILNQSSTTFNDRQLENVVESNERAGGETMKSAKSAAFGTITTTSIVVPSTSAPSDNSRQSSNKTTYVGSGNYLIRPSGTSFRDDGGAKSSSSYSILNKITNATQSRKPMQPIDINDSESGRLMSIVDSHSHSHNDKQQQQHSSCLIESTAQSSSTTYLDGKQVGYDSTIVRSATTLTVPNINDDNNKSLDGRSKPETAFSDGKQLDLVSSATTTTTRHFNDLCSLAGQDDDEQLRVKFVEQLYGDSALVHTAAITIQRAFRKYQICKRFRTITEQLRHTCQSSPIQQQRDQAQANRSKRDTNNKQQRLSSKDSNEQQQQQQTLTSSSIPFVSGTTRAAAWDSLSYAASRLAASAAAATANTKQALVNGVTKSASSQHVAAAATTTSTSAFNSASGQAKDTQANLAAAASVNDQQRSPSSSLKSDAVVEAAINFQQLESIRKRRYRVGLNIFNKNPDKGLSFLTAHSFIDTTPPYTKGQPSYYLSNQLQFIDNKQQHLATAASGHLNHNALQQQQHQQFNNCQFCYEEENLKRNIAHFLLHRKGLAKERIGQYLGNLQAEFNQDVLRYYLQELDFHGLQVDIALRKFLATLRLPGEAQKIERFVDYFTQRYVQCQQQQQHQFTNNINRNIQLTKHNNNNNNSNNQKQHRSAPPTPTPNRPSRSSNQQQSANSAQSNYQNNLTLLSKDEIFILTFAIIMLNTDLHSPSLKPTSRMSASQFVHNLRGVFKSQTITESNLIEIYERVKANQITTTPDHVTHVMKVQQGLTTTNFQKKELPNLCVPHRRLVCFCRLFEVYDINKKERVGQHQREIFLFNDLLLVTKLARRARANSIQQYAYRQSIPLQNLHVQLFQSAHYNFGIRLSQKGSDEALIMFNARNHSDQSQFVDDLTESIAEMDEMENIRAHKIVDTIHFKHQERFRHHAMLHNNNLNENNINQEPPPSNGLCDNDSLDNDEIFNNNENQSPGARLGVLNEQENQDKFKNSDSSSGQTAPKRRLQSKFSSMSNLSSVAESRDDNDDDPSRPTASGTDGLRPNRSFLQQPGRRQQQRQAPQRPDADNSGATERSCSSGSVHSLDSGLFLSRDVSPNQSG